MEGLDKEHTSHTERASTRKPEVSVDTTSVDHHAVLSNILKTSPVKTWGSGSLHLYAVCLLVYLCSTMNGLSRVKSKSNKRLLLTLDRLRRISYGFDQRRAQLHCIL